MFNRRIVGSGCIPRCMYTRLRVCSAAQAMRMLPPLISLHSSRLRHRCGESGQSSLGQFFTSTELACVADGTALNSVLFSLSVTPCSINGLLNTRPLLLRMLSDTMCTYSMIVTQKFQLFLFAV